MKSSRAGSMVGPVPHGGAQSKLTTVPALSAPTATPVALGGVRVAPSLLTATVYVPGATLGNWKAPLASLIAVRADGPVSVTSTPATPEPRDGERRRIGHGDRARRSRRSRADQRR